MKNLSFGVMDSGVGGISLLKRLNKEFPYLKFIYLGDNLNAPYGNKSKFSLMNVAMKNIDLLKRYDVDGLILACNTLSTNLIGEINEYSSLKTFGIFPPVEKLMLKDEKTLLICTEATAKIYQRAKKIKILPLRYVVGEIERSLDKGERVNLEKVFKMENIDVKQYKYIYDNVILGCTHYNFIKNEIFDHLRPKKIFSGENDVIFNLKKYLVTIKSLEKNKRFNPVFIGDCALKNKKIFEKSGQYLLNQN